MRTETNGSLDDIQIGSLTNTAENDDNVTVREYINSAVYVETTYDMAPCKQNSIYMNIPGSGDHPKLVKIKRCVCFTNPNECPCHPKTDEDDFEPLPSPYPPKTQFTSSTTALLKKQPFECSNFDSDSGITVKATISTPDEFRLSIPSLTTMSTVRMIDEQTKEENFRNWCARKDHERKLQEERESLLNDIKRKQREEQVEIERENFKRWLANKKKEEELKKKEMEKKEEEERLKEELKEKRVEQNQLNFQLWLKRKEQTLLEKKVREQMDLLKLQDERQKREEYSTKAYEIWLQQSKNKPKPIPLNRGLESLKSSVSVTYINPQPWVPNIDVTKKPTSQ